MDDIFGKISAPQGVQQYNDLAGGGQAIGLVIFLSRMVQVITILAGVWVLFNFVMAGMQLVTAGGKSDAYSKMTEKLTMSVVGIIIIVASYTLAGLVGLLLFGDATYILNPKICGPTATC